MISLPAAYKRTNDLFVQLIHTTRYTWMQMGLIGLVAILYIWMPQSFPIDWYLNTHGFWSDIPHTYLSNRNFVYPPWGLILLVPYYLIQAYGARVLSVMTIGLLAYKRAWPFKNFFMVVLGPYFLVTMNKSAMDILVIVLPLVLWEYLENKKFGAVGRGLAIAVMLLKPQCTALLILYLVLKNFKKWKETIQIALVAGLLVIPINFIGDPPLISQWMDNILNPSPQNRSYWGVNNFSLTARYGFWEALLIVGLAVLFFAWAIRMKKIAWNGDMTISGLLLSSMFLLPYTSQQSLSAAYSLIPMFPNFLLQWAGVGLAFLTYAFDNHLSLWILVLSIVSLYIYGWFGVSRGCFPTNSEASSRQG